MSDHAPIDPAKVRRQKRLEETLRENLRRRKEQARERASSPFEDDERGEDTPSGDGSSAKA